MQKEDKKFYLKINTSTGHSRIFTHEGLVAIYTNPDEAFAWCVSMQYQSYRRLPILISNECHEYELN